MAYSREEVVHECARFLQPDVETCRAVGGCFGETYVDFGCLIAYNNSAVLGNLSRPRAGDVSRSRKSVALEQPDRSGALFTLLHRAAGLMIDSRYTRRPPPHPQRVRSFMP